jgi:3,4-dihydroxy-9,10-secoandrosta-1,3,5(10)-triene-9,17-dione 4,5-dioxygenase
MPVNALGHLAIATPKRDEWIDFARDVLGIQRCEDGTNGTTRFRVDDRSYRLEIQDGAEEEVVRIGWEVPNAAALADVIQRFEKEGLPIRRCGDEEAASREVVGLAAGQDVSGFDVEFFYGQRKSVQPFISPKSAQFVTGDYGMGHVVLLTPAFDEALRLYTEVLDFRLSDTMQMGPSRVAFLRCNPRHHSLAFVEAPMKGIHHFMLEVTDIDMVGRGYDVCRDRGDNIIMDLGRHSNDEMFSFYAATPSGFGVEYGHGGMLVDDASWTVTEIAGPSLWGHRGQLSIDHS